MKYELEPFEIKDMLEDYYKRNLATNIYVVFEELFKDKLPIVQFYIYGKKQKQNLMIEFKAQIPQDEVKRIIVEYLFKSSIDKYDVDIESSIESVDAGAREPYLVKKPQFNRMTIKKKEGK